MNIIFSYSPIAAGNSLEKKGNQILYYTKAQIEIVSTEAKIRF